jgi:ABC transporter substrate binding protein
MRRRTFIALLGATAVWPLPARAQPHTVPRIGILLVAGPEPMGPFREALHGLGYARRNRDLIIAFAARDRIPAVYPERNYVQAGGLMCYGIADLVEPFRQAAAYVDRILRGAQPAHLPVQAPTRYATTLNLKTAKALGFAVPETLLVHADEVIE